MMISAELLNGEYRIKFNGSKYQFNDYINKVMRFPEKRWDGSSKSWSIPVASFNRFKSLFQEDEIDILAAVKKKPKINPKLKDIGKSMKLKPFEYQKEAINFCLHNPESLLLLPCGSGKSPITLGVYLEARERKIVNTPALIIVKASLKTQWLREVTKFTNFKATIVQTKSSCTTYYKQKVRKLEKQMSQLDKIRNKSEARDIQAAIDKAEETANAKFMQQFHGVDIYILNYETLNDANVRSALHKMKLDFVACDEFQMVKSRKAARSKAVYEFAEAKMKIGATATPVQKNPEDLFGLYSFLEPSLFGGWASFARKYIVYAGFGKISKFKNLDHLKELISPFVFIKTKEEIADQLPKTMVLQRYCEMTAAQEETNTRIMLDLDELKAKEFSIRCGCRSEAEAMQNADLQQVTAQIMALQTFAQELADDPHLFDMSESKMLENYRMHDKSSPKTDMLIDLIDEIIDSGEKVCVFSRYERMQRIIIDRIQKAKLDTKIAIVNGKIKDSERYSQVYDKFQDDPEYKILLLSDAGAEGLNLSKCKYLIEFDLAISYSIQTQRHGRIERADSVHDNVIVYQLIAQNSYDEISVRIIEKKEGYDAELFKS
jgi:SNF2 family DNA or RNA helicase